MSNYNIILASGSPRRRELMDRIGAKYTVIPSDREEDMSDCVPSRLVEGLSKMKAEDIFDKLSRMNRLSDEDRVSYLSSVSRNGIVNFDFSSDSYVIIGSDTVVAYNSSILGKPHSTEEAFNMVKMLSGNTHEVYTGVCILICEGGHIIKSENYNISTAVSITPMSDEEISRYIATGEPMDKAGAYAIQGLFCPYIEKITGDYYNIVGFPISSIYHKLIELGVNIYEN